MFINFVLIIDACTQGVEQVEYTEQKNVHTIAAKKVIFGDHFYKATFGGSNKNRQNMRPRNTI